MNCWLAPAQPALHGLRPQELHSFAVHAAERLTLRGWNYVHLSAGLFPPLDLYNDWIEGNILQLIFQRIHTYWSFRNSDPWSWKFPTWLFRKTHLSTQNLSLFYLNESPGEGRWCLTDLYEGQCNIRRAQASYLWFERAVTSWTPILKISTFWVITPCCPLKVSWYFTVESRSRIVKLYLHSPQCLRDILLNQPSTGTTLPI
jgi:hypothetical protein